jgi:hypothetical protein
MSSEASTGGDRHVGRQRGEGLLGPGIVDRHDRGDVHPRSRLLVHRCDRVQSDPERPISIARAMVASVSMAMPASAGVIA